MKTTTTKQKTHKKPHQVNTKDFITKSQKVEQAGIHMDKHSLNKATFAFALM